MFRRMAGELGALTSEVNKNVENFFKPDPRNLRRRRYR
jgi:hypothetical protein